jgi:hypothetical protein
VVHRNRRRSGVATWIAMDRSEPENALAVGPRRGRNLLSWRANSLTRQQACPRRWSCTALRLGKNTVEQRPPYGSPKTHGCPLLDDFFRVSIHELRGGWRFVRTPFDAQVGACPRGFGRTWCGPRARRSERSVRKGHRSNARSPQAHTGHLTPSPSEPFASESAACRRCSY